ncbi:Wzz/FepE/Etk N-terminal domain-containing protein [Photobacterium leiognathi subsp. mandapamensis]|uniref:Wzz/FepE/Etk N-terminal domain-containing protein n=1 Tax=Photobacterium leiognathi TaxID=553611 RepID=UPI003AF3B72E
MSDNQFRNGSASAIDGITFLQFTRVLWQEKLIIFLCATVFITSSIVYVLTAQQWWTSDAVVTTSQYQNTADIRSELTNLYVASGDKSKIDDIFSGKEMLSQFITEFNSFDRKKEFIEQSKIMKNYTLDYENDGKGKFIYDWANKISAIQADRTQLDVYKLSFEATTPKLSQELLSSYSEFISGIVRNDIIYSLTAKVSHIQQMLNARKESLEAEAKLKLSLELSKTNYALDIAKSANALKPIPNMNDKEIFNINLGSEALSEKSKVLNKMTDLSVFEPSLSKVTVMLNLLSKFKLDKNESIQSVRYLQKPSLPLNRDKPQRSLIVFLSALFGIIVGIGVALFKYSSKKD